MMFLNVLCFLLIHQKVFTKRIDLPCSDVHEFKSDSEELHLKWPTDDFHLSCYWLLKSRFRKMFHVNFQIFDIDTEFNRNCTKREYLLFEDLSFKESVCLQKLPDKNVLIFHGPVLLIDLYGSLRDTAKTHFVITLEPVTCGNVIRGEKVHSLSIENVTQESTMCAWEITARQGTTIKFECSSIDLLQSENCQEEALLVNIYGDVLFLDNERYCGRGNVSHTYSIKNKMNIAFFRRKPSVKGGFNCSIEYIHEPIRDEKQLVKGCGKNKSLFQPSRVVGGTEATPRLPMVGIGDSSGSFECGGTLIHPQIVLTAAHCLDLDLPCTPFPCKPKKIYVPEEHGIGKYYTIEDIITHENFNLEMNFNDIALIRITNATHAKERDVACITPRNFQTLHKSVVVFGWGRTLDPQKEVNETVFYKLKMTGMSWKECERWLWENVNAILTERSFCTKAEEGNACFGDSGGPALVIYEKKLTVAGITAMGSPDCMTPPTVFTEVSLYRSWIFRNVEKLLSRSES